MKEDKPLWARGALYFIHGKGVELPGGRMDHDDILAWCAEQTDCDERTNDFSKVTYEYEEEKDWS